MKWEIAMKLKIAVVRNIARQCLNTDYSNRTIGDVNNVSSTSVSNYRSRLQEKALTWEMIKGLDDLELKKSLFGDSISRFRKILPNLNHVHERLLRNKHLCLKVIHDEYCSIYKERAYSYTQFCFHYRKFKRKLALAMRIKRYPGEVFFIDFAGTTIPWKCESSEIRKAQILVIVSGYSSYTFACALPSQKEEDFIYGHIKAFEFFGGVPEAIIPDNLKSAVIKAGIDLTLNKAYLEMAEHYIVEVLPARVGKPKDKGLVEEAVLHVSRWILARLKERTFFSVDEINDAIQELLPELNNRKMTNYEGSRKSRFEQFEKPLLKALPEKPYEYGKWLGEQSVPNDYHVKVDKHFYSVSYKFVSEKVICRLTRNQVKIFLNHKCVATHQRSFEIGGFTTNVKHQSPEHRAYANQSIDTYLAWAKNLGDAVEQVVCIQYEGKNNQSIIANKACSTLKKLSRLYDHDDFVAACQRALDIGSPNVTRIRSILKSGIFRIPLDSFSKQNAIPRHSNIRGASYYAAGGNHERA